MPLLAALLMLAAEPAKSCDPPRDYAHWLEIEKVPARQGAKLSVQATRGLSFTWEPVPLRCTSRWKVSNPRAVKLSRDRTSLSVAKDARPGDVVTISYRVRGKRAEATIKIVSRDASTLTGTYRQTALSGCAQSGSIGELVFDDKGRFAVTYQPFETYNDYWGSYRFDPATNALSMTIDDGNFKPADTLLAGTARREPGKLVLDGFDFGGQSPTRRDGAGGCRYEFTG